MLPAKSMDRIEKIQQTIGGLQKIFECPICLELMTNPVAAKCSHKFCRFCLLEALGSKRSAPCPLCKESFTKRSLMPLPKWNEIVTNVRNLVTAFQKDTGLEYTPPSGAVSCSPLKLSQQLSSQKSDNLKEPLLDNDEPNEISTRSSTGKKSRARRPARKKKAGKVEESKDPTVIEEERVKLVDDAPEKAAVEPSKVNIEDKQMKPVAVDLNSCTSGANGRQPNLLSKNKKEKRLGKVNVECRNISPSEQNDNLSNKDISNINQTNLIKDAEFALPMASRKSVQKNLHSASGYPGDSQTDDTCDSTASMTPARKVTLWLQDMPSDAEIGNSMKVNTPKIGETIQQENTNQKESKKNFKKSERLTRSKMKNCTESPFTDSSVEIRKIVTRTYGKPRISTKKSKVDFAENFDQVVGNIPNGLDSEIEQSQKVDNNPEIHEEEDTAEKVKAMTVNADHDNKEDLLNTKEQKEILENFQSKRISIKLSNSNNPVENYQISDASRKDRNLSFGKKKQTSALRLRKKEQDTRNSKSNTSKNNTVVNFKMQNQKKIFQTRNKRYTENEKIDENPAIDDRKEAKVPIISKKDQEVHAAGEDPYAYLMSQRTPKVKKKKGKSKKEKTAIKKEPVCVLLNTSEICNKENCNKERKSSEESKVLIDTCDSERNEKASIQEVPETPLFQFSQIIVEKNKKQKTGTLTRKSVSKPKANSDLPSTQDQMEKLINKISDAEDHDLMTMSQFQKEVKVDKIFCKNKEASVEGVCEPVAKPDNSDTASSDEEDTGILLHREDTEIIESQISQMKGTNAMKECEDEVNIESKNSPGDNEEKESSQIVNLEAVVSEQTKEDLSQASLQIVDEYIPQQNACRSSQSFVLAAVTDLEELGKSGCTKNSTCLITSETLPLSGKNDSLTNSQSNCNKEDIANQKNQENNSNSVVVSQNYNEECTYASDRFMTQNTSESVSLLPQIPSSIKQKLCKENSPNAHVNPGGEEYFALEMQNALVTTVPKDVGDVMPSMEASVDIDETLDPNVDQSTVPEKIDDQVEELEKATLNSTVNEADRSESEENIDLNKEEEGLGSQPNFADDDIPNAQESFTEISEDSQKSSQGQRSQRSSQRQRSQKSLEGNESQKSSQGLGSQRSSKKQKSQSQSQRSSKGQKSPRASQEQEEYPENSNSYSGSDLQLSQRSTKLELPESESVQDIFSGYLELEKQNGFGTYGLSSSIQHETAEMIDSVDIPVDDTAAEILDKIKLDENDKETEFDSEERKPCNVESQKQTENVSQGRRRSNRIKKNSKVTADIDLKFSDEIASEGFTEKDNLQKSAVSTEYVSHTDDNKKEVEMPRDEVDAKNENTVTEMKNVIKANEKLKDKSDDVETKCSESSQKKPEVTEDGFIIPAINENKSPATSLTNGISKGRRLVFKSLQRNKQARQVFYQRSPEVRTPVSRLVNRKESLEIVPPTPTELKPSSTSSTNIKEIISEEVKIIHQNGDSQVEVTENQTLNGDIPAEEEELPSLSPEEQSCSIISDPLIPHNSAVESLSESKDLQQIKEGSADLMEENVCSLDSQKEANSTPVKVTGSFFDNQDSPEPVNTSKKRKRHSHKPVISDDEDSADERPAKKTSFGRDEQTEILEEENVEDDIEEPSIDQFSDDDILFSPPPPSPLDSLPTFSPNGESEPHAKPEVTSSLQEALDGLNNIKCKLDGNEDENLESEEEQDIVLSGVEKIVNSDDEKQDNAKVARKDPVWKVPDLPVLKSRLSQGKKLAGLVHDKKEMVGKTSQKESINKENNQSRSGLFARKKKHDLSQMTDTFDAEYDDDNNEIENFNSGEMNKSKKVPLSIVTSVNDDVISNKFKKTSHKRSFSNEQTNSQSSSGSAYFPHDKRNKTQPKVSDRPSDEERKQGRPEWSIVASGLRSNQKALLAKFVQGIGCMQTSKFTNKTTHVIVKSIEGIPKNCQRTLKYFQAIAGGRWIVSFQWIEDCLEKQAILEEEEYEIVGDDSNGCAHYGPRKGRLTEHPLLEDFELCCYGSFLDLSRNDLTGLLRLTGALYVQEPTQLTYEPDKTTLIVIESRSEDGEENAVVMPQELRNIQRRFSVTVVSLHWLLDSIAQFEVQDISDYIVK